MGIITISQAASYLQVCEKAVRRLIEKNRNTGGNYGENIVYIGSRCG